MRFLELKNKLGGQLVFTTNDIKKIDSGFNVQRLSEWQDKGYIKKVIKGFYVFSDKELSEEDLFAIANRIYKPSYVSLQSALRYYNLIPEGVFTITSVSTKKTQRFDTKIGSFDYRNVKPDLFSDYKIIGDGAKKAKIATPEKAIVDYFYLNTNFETEEEISELRISKDSFIDKVDLKKLNKITKKAKNKRMKKRINLLLAWLNINNYGGF